MPYAQDDQARNERFSAYDWILHGLEDTRAAPVKTLLIRDDSRADKTILGGILSKHELLIAQHNKSAVVHQESV